MKKYKLTDETIIVDGRTLHRIECVTAFGAVQAGDIGGYVESENNLSQLSNAWVSGNAKVYGDAQVSDNAWVYGNAKVYGDAKVYGSALVYDNAKVSDNAWVSDNAKVSDNAWVRDNAWVSDNAQVGDNAWVSDNAQVSGSAWVSGDARVSDNAQVGGSAWVSGDARVSDNADYIVFKNYWSSGRYFTWTRSNDMWRVGCFYGTGEKLVKKAYAKSEKSGKHYEAYVRFVEQLKQLD